MTSEERTQIRREAFSEVIAGYDELLAICTGGDVPLIDTERETNLLQNLKRAVEEMRDKS